MGKYLDRILRNTGGTLKSEQWFCYKDDSGICYAQADHFILFPTHVLLIECKLSQKNYAFAQMGGLYVPLLKRLYERPIVGVQACRNLTFKPEKYWVEEIEDQFPYRGSEAMLTWHAYGI